MIKILNILNELESKVLYSAVVLHDDSKQQLLNTFSDLIPSDWKKFAHHMTIAFGKGVENPDDLLIQELPLPPQLLLYDGLLLDPAIYPAAAPVQNPGDES